MGFGISAALISAIDLAVDGIKAVTDKLPDSGALNDLATALCELDAANIPADIDSLLTRLTAQRALNLDLLDLTTFKQETVAATDVDGTTWKDLLDKSTITKPTKICGFKVTVGGTWAGKAQVRITDGAPRYSPSRTSMSRILSSLVEPRWSLTSLWWSLRLTAINSSFGQLTPVMVLGKHSS